MDADLRHHTFRVPYYVLFAVTICLANGTAVHAQVWTYVTVDVPYTPAPSSNFTAAAGTCKNPDGTPTADNEIPNNGFVRTNSSVKTDVWAFTTGTCDVRAWGQHYSYEYHYIDFVRVQSLAPGGDPATGWSLTGYFTNHTASFVLNSISGTNPNPNPPPPDNTTPALSVGVNNVGEYQVRYQLLAASTGCAFPTSSSYSVKTLNAVACLPQWKPADNSGNVPRFPTAEHVRIIYPTTLKSETEAVIDTWNFRLTGSGLVFDKDENGSCAPSDERCLFVNTIGACPLQADACGCSLPGSSDAGIYTTAGNIWVPAISRTEAVSNTFREWVIGHELGHLLGLEDKHESCAATISVMGSPQTAVCGTVTPTDAATSPTVSDGLPVTKAVYGSAPRKTCGW